MAPRVDGNDVEAVFDATHAARERALEGGGPTLICAETMRMHGHGAHDDARYVSPDLLEKWARRDPVDRHRGALVESGMEDQVEEIETSVDEEVREAAKAAENAPLPDPSTAVEDVLCEGEPEPLGFGGEAPWSGHEEGSG